LAWLLAEFAHLFHIGKPDISLADASILFPEGCMVRPVKLTGSTLAIGLASLHILSANGKAIGRPGDRLR
jgi:hypothetical protein